ncbi:endonuclease domain-containing protein, partial [Flavobacterium jumunjinense]
MQTKITAKINDKSIKENVLKLPYNPELKNRAKSLRKGYNFAEVVFWKQVRNKSFWGIDFDRQKIIGNYIVDFYIKKLGLVIEIDGESHNNKENYDLKRENYMLSQGVLIFKTTNFRILHDLDNVMKELEHFII